MNVLDTSVAVDHLRGLPAAAGLLRHLVESGEVWVRHTRRSDLRVEALHRRVWVRERARPQERPFPETC